MRAGIRRENQARQALRDARSDLDAVGREHPVDPQVTGPRALAAATRVGLKHLGVLRRTIALKVMARRYDRAVRKEVRTRQALSRRGELPTFYDARSRPTGTELLDSVRSEEAWQSAYAGNATGVMARLGAMPMIGLHLSVPDANAYWDPSTGRQMFGSPKSSFDGLGTDSIVGHELYSPHRNDAVSAVQRDKAAVLRDRDTTGGGMELVRDDLSTFRKTHMAGRGDRHPDSP